MRRINELEMAFDSPDRYGRGLDWTGYTVHDAANILRRYINKLPQPIVPLEFYEQYRAPLRGHQEEAVGSVQAHTPELGGFDVGEAISTYQRLITELPPLNRQLLLYILDLLAVFASKADKNRMDASNLASIFQPGMLNHPDHMMKPTEYSLNQDVVIFLIQQQDHFLVGMPGTAADEQTVKDIQNAPKTRTPNSPRSPKIGLRRSASNASGGADSARRLGALRRNVSGSSKHSRHSSNIPSPGTPGTPQAIGSASGVHRSNTVPSKKSPNVPSGRFSRPFDPSTPSSQPPSAGFLAPEGHPVYPIHQQTQTQQAEDLAVSQASPVHKNAQMHDDISTSSQPMSTDRNIQADSSKHVPVSPKLAPVSTATPAKERRVSNLFSKSPNTDTSPKDTRQPNKLKKKRMPESSNPSARSSSNSLLTGPDSPGSKQEFFSPMPTPRPAESDLEDPLDSAEPPKAANTAATPSSDTPTPVAEQTQTQSMDNKASAEPLQSLNNDSSLRPLKSPPLSVHSRSSVTDFSEADVLNTEKPKKKHSRWRSSFAASKSSGEKSTPKASSSQLEASSIQEQSTPSVISGSNATKSTPNTSQQILSTTETPIHSSNHAQNTSANDEPSPPKGTEIAPDKGAEQGSPERKGPIKWLKAKVAQAKEERKEREAEKERAKSPPRPHDSTAVAAAHEGSKQSLSAIANESTLPVRDRSGAEADAEATPIVTGSNDHHNATATETRYKPAVDEGTTDVVT